MRTLVRLVVLLALLVAADSVARVFAAARLSAGLASALSLEKDPEVSIGGFPFLWDLVQGTLETMTVSTGELGTDPVSLDHLEVKLNEVSFSSVDALTGDLRQARVASGEGKARLSISVVEKALRASGGLVGGISVGDLPGVDVSGTTLTFGPAQFDLPVLAEGMTYTSARIVDGAVHLTFRLRRTLLRLS